MATMQLKSQEPGLLPSLPQGYAYDESGRIICKFPPFPIPPEGVKIKSFEEFQPCGIQISFDEEVERDGQGNPTIRLLKQHDNESAPKKKKKNVKTMATGETISRVSTWWEDWEAGEVQRIMSAKRIDPNIHPVDRLALIVEEFVRSHHLHEDIELLRPWEKYFQPFLGCTEASVRPRLKRSFRATEDDEEDEVVDVIKGIVKPKPRRSSTEQATSTYHADAVANTNQSPFESDQTFAARVERKKLEREFLTQSFLDDALNAIKVFLSSYVFELGMYSEPRALQRVPRLVHFFIKYVLGTRALRETEAPLKVALSVAEQAITQLPLTGHIGYNIPDRFSKGLTEIFGSQKYPNMWDPAARLDSMEVDVERANPGDEKLIEKESTTSAENVNDDNQGSAADTSGWPTTDDGGDGGSWGDAAKNGAWGDSGVGTSWGMDIDSSPGWDSFSTQWSASRNLIVLLGPTTLPLTHEIGYVEESTRAISRIIMPSEVASQIKATTKDGRTLLRDPLDALARIELKPYEYFAPPENPHAIVQKPTLLNDPYSSSSSIPSKAPKHDSQKDTITILVDPDWVREEMRNSINIGLKGVFVQIVPKSDDSSSASSPTKKGKKGAKDGTGERVFWYAEKLHMIIPSFWTELGEYDRIFRDRGK